MDYQSKKKYLQINFCSSRIIIKWFAVRTDAVIAYITFDIPQDHRTYIVIDWKWYFHCEYAAEGLTFGNSVYSIRFDEEFSQKVELIFLLSATWSLLFYFSLFFPLVIQWDFMICILEITLLNWQQPHCLLQKFKSSNPFGIKYKFHLEVPLIIKSLYSF